VSEGCEPEGGRDCHVVLYSEPIDRRILGLPTELPDSTQQDFEQEMMIVTETRNDASGQLDWLRGATRLYEREVVRMVEQHPRRGRMDVRALAAEAGVA
jgi:hypothetical protein